MLLLYLINPKSAVKADQQAQLLFYFAGHGIPPKDNDGEAGYLVPQDATAENLGSFLFMRDEQNEQNEQSGNLDALLSMRKLHDELVKLGCHHLPIILDCCFAGGFRNTSRHIGGGEPEQLSKERYERYLTRKAYQVIASAMHDQKAIDHTPDRQSVIGIPNHSPFAEALFEALDKTSPQEAANVVVQLPADYTKDGITTVTELSTYIEKRLWDKTKNYKKPQIPQFWSLKEHDEGEFFFLTGDFDPAKLPDAPTLSEANNPYRGLESYDEAHSKFFFGRGELVEDLQKHISDRSFTVVLGVSGSGKSSLVKAGLIPNLRQHPSATWQILEPMRPGTTPIDALAKTMLALTQEAIDSELQLLDNLTEIIRHTRREFPQSQELGELAAEWRKTALEDKLLLVIKYFDPLVKHSNNAEVTQLLEQLRQWGLSRKRLVFEHLEAIKPRCNEQELAKVLILYDECLAYIKNWNQTWQQDLTTWCQKYPWKKLLLVVDQFEELITLCQQEERETFLNILKTILETYQQVRVVATLRADFEPRFIDSEQLKSRWQNARFLVRAMRPDELRQAIEGPALENVLYFETDLAGKRSLVNQLIDEVGQVPGALPLLSFSLSEMYRRSVTRQQSQGKSDRTLTWDDYRKVGGVAGSLTRRATQEFDSLLEDSASEEEGKAYQGALRKVILRMVTIEGTGVARRRVPESELVYSDSEENKRVALIVNRLVKARLLVKGHEMVNNQAIEEPYVEPVHDFLVRGWGKLQEWIKQVQEDLLLRQRLTPAAKDWSLDQGGLWTREAARLARLEEMLKSSNNWLNKLEKEFVNASKKQRLDELQEAEKQRDEAVQDQITALSGLSEAHLETDQLGALVSALKAGKLLQRMKKSPWIREEIFTNTELLLCKTLNSVREFNRLQAHQGSVVTAVFSPNGEFVFRT